MRLREFDRLSGLFLSSLRVSRHPGRHYDRYFESVAATDRAGNYASATVRFRVRHH